MLTKVLHDALCSQLPTAVINNRALSKPPKKVSNDIVRVDRSKPVVYPSGYNPLYTNLLDGPSEFSLNSLEQWLHKDQETRVVTGNFLHQYLRDNEMLGNCLGFIELLEIQKLGAVTFRKHFPSRAVFGWRSVVRYRDGHLCVPHLTEACGEVYLHWNWLGNDWDVRGLALRFGK